MSAPELAAAVGSDRQTLRRLEQRGLIATRDSQLRRAPAASRLGRAGRAPPAPARAAPGGRGDRRRARRRRRGAAQPAPARGHRLGQDRGLPGRGRGGAGARPGRDRPRPRDRSRPAGRGTLPRSPRRPLRRPPLGPLGRRALRRVAAPAQRRGQRLRRAPLRRLCSCPRSRPDRDRRGARPLLQAGGRPDLRRPHRRPPPRRRQWRRARRRHRHAAARVMAGAAAIGAAATGRRAADAAGEPGRHARSRPALGPAPRRDLGGAGGRPRRRRQGDRDDQPARLRPLADLPLLRAPLGLPQLRRLADRPPPQRPPRLPPLRPRRGAAARLHRVRLDDALAGRRRHRTDRNAAPRAARADAGLPARFRHRHRTRRPRPHPRRIRGGAERGPGRHPDGRQGPRFPGGDAERDPRRRRHPALPRLPRRGAHLRDGRPAGRPHGPRRAPGER